MRRVSLARIVVFAALISIGHGADTPSTPAPQAVPQLGGNSMQIAAYLGGMLVLFIGGAWLLRNGLPMMQKNKGPRKLNVSETPASSPPNDSPRLLERNEQTRPRFAGDRLALVSAPGRVVGQQNAAGPEPPPSAIADDEIDRTRQIDDVLAARCVVEIEVVVAVDLAKHHAARRHHLRDATKRSALIELHVDVFEVRLAVGPCVNAHDLHGLRPSGWFNEEALPYHRAMSLTACPQQRFFTA